MSTRILGFLLFASVASAAPPSVSFKEKTITAEIGDWVSVKADVVGGKGDTKYSYPKGLNPFPANLLKDSSGLLFCPKIEGTFTILAYAGNEDGASELATTTLIIGKGSPSPVDPPQPSPSAKKIVVVVIEETSLKTVASAKTYTDIRLWGKSSGNSVEYVEASDLIVKTNGYDGYVSKVGLPAILVFDAEATGVSKPLTSFKMIDKVSFDTEIKKVLK